VTISAAQWRGRRLPRAGVPISAAEQLELPDDAGGAGPLAHQQRRHARAQRAGTAAAVNDRFMDLIVLLSVLMFLALVTGLGLLVLQSAQR